LNPLFAIERVVRAESKGLIVGTVIRLINVICITVNISTIINFPPIIKLKIKSNNEKITIKK
jgi:hypothetical protein